MSKSKAYCSVFGCGTYYSPELSFHGYPSENGITVRWKTESGVEEKISVREAWIRALKADRTKVSKHTKICSKHFSKDNYILPDYVSKPHLKKTAVPHLFLPSSPRGDRKKPSKSRVKPAFPGSAPADNRMFGHDVIVVQGKQIAVETKDTEENVACKGKKVESAATKSQLPFMPDILCHQLDEDVENIMQYRLMGGGIRLRLKEGTLPHIFDCHKGWNGPVQHNKYSHKKRRHDFVALDFVKTVCCSNIEKNTENTVPVNRECISKFPFNWILDCRTDMAPSSPDNSIEEGEIVVIKKEIEIFCCICYESTPPHEAVALCTPDKYYSQFGLMLCSLLKLDRNSLLTRFCCISCNKQIMECFKLLIDINVSAMLTSKRQKNESLSEALDRGCSQCGAVFPSVEELTDHYMNHVLDKSYKTTRTKGTQVKIFSTKVLVGNSVEVQTDVTSFEKIAEEEKEFWGNDSPATARDHCYNKIRTNQVQSLSRLCYICGKVLSDHNEMRKHLATHGLIFKPLKKHKVENLDITPLVCAHCNISFQQRPDIINHMMLKHGADAEGLKQCLGTNRRAWICDICEEKFLNFELIRRHYIDAHNKKFTVECEECKMKFGASASLRKHIAHVHLHPIDKYPCQLCNYKGRSDAGLYKHIKNHHKGENSSQDKKKTRTSISFKKLRKKRKENVFMTEERDSNFLHGTVGSQSDREAERLDKYDSDSSYISPIPMLSMESKKIYYFDDDDEKEVSQIEFEDRESLNKSRHKRGSKEAAAEINYDSDSSYTSPRPLFSIKKKRRL